MSYTLYSVKLQEAAVRYKSTVRAEFISRPNRFIAHVLLNGKEETVHVKNTGRCRELLVPGTEVWLAPSDNPARKTVYDLVTVKKGDLLINMDSQAPNVICEEWLRVSGLFSGDAAIRREVKYGDSRYDIYVEDGERRAFVEVKGVTLEENGVAMFPDAPTERGVKHINGLVSAFAAGYEAYVVFIVQMKGIKKLRPNDVTHKAFGDALRRAAEAGVKVIAVDCVVTEDSVTADSTVEVDLSSAN